MNRYKVMSALALLILVLALPAYALLEPERMAGAQSDLRQEMVADAAAIYVENCALCHGAAGEGLGPVPGLDSDALRSADYDALFKTIARGRYGTTMAAWHTEEGGILNDYQVDELVALIRYVDWPQVRELSAEQGLIPPTLPVPQVTDAFLEEIAGLSPEGDQWAAGINLYANNCTVCHGINGEGSDLGVPLNTPDLRTRDADELARIIREGVPGTVMASWQNALSSSDIVSLVSFLQNWDAIEGSELLLQQPEPIHIDLDNPQEVLALGERIFSTTCSACHGENGSGGTGPALNSLQVLTTKSDEQIKDTIVNGGRRPNSSMPAFGDRLTGVEISALVDFIRGWEPTATWVENPRGTAQGGGPPWLRATPDANNPVNPNQGNGNGRGNRGGGPPWRQTSAQDNTVEPVPGAAFEISGTVMTIEGNLLAVESAENGLIDTMLGPPWFWSENGIPLTPGDRLTLEVFESADHVETNWLVNHTSGQSIHLRTADGKPVWGGGNSAGTTPP